MGSEPEVGVGEAITGAELFHYLIEQNQSQLCNATRKLQEYTELVCNLRSLTARCRRTVLAPVAGGLAYFEARLTATNNILVLLGDGWFAERSAAQAVAIAERRMAFLRREISVLEEERRNVEQRKELFVSEVPEAERVMEEVLQQKEKGLSGAYAAYRGETSGSEGTYLSGDPSIAVDASSVTAAVPDEPTLPSHAPPCSPSSVNIGDSTELGDLAVFDEHDDLTEDELAEIERLVGDQIDDDEFVERIMTEYMIAKKESRVRQELERRRTEAAESRQEASPASHKASQNTHVSLPSGEAGTVVKHSYVTPADIGAAVSTSVHKDAAETQVLPPESTSSGGKAKKSVSFHESVVDPTRVPDLPTPVFPAYASLSAPVSQVGAASVVEAEGRDTSVARVSYMLGDVVERGGPGVAGGTLARSAVTLGTTHGKKHKSLFLQEMEGR